MEKTDRQSHFSQQDQRSITTSRTPYRSGMITYDVTAVAVAYQRRTCCRGYDTDRAVNDIDVHSPAGAKVRDLMAGRQALVRM